MTTEEIKRLLDDNKKKLLNEIDESKELAYLLRESSKRALTEDEKAKVKEQILDICKAIPAFAIFLLPGGAILLPLLIKLIPNLLPSSFREK